MQTISKTLKIFLTALILSNIVLMACVVYFFLNNKHSLSAERIDIKDRSGNNRVVIANTDNIPQPIIKGKTYKRAYAPAGLIFYDKNGDERGGLAITDNEETNLNALAFDYQNADAIGILAQDNKHDNYFRAGLLINDKDLSGKPGHNINRINLLTENGNASLVMKDNNEIPRIILKVDSLGNPSIEMLDDKGKVKWKQ
ncbi:MULTISPECIES: hypothetical protein [Sphingobacterium]|uniref:Uncharacterized protein n=3 Tax=Sphingobacterium TaxID=28453 RepID=A0A2X2JRC5_SPHMU|nr:MULTISPECIES: hypothetical protein [Sphingobacterium]HAF34880.1 hypothetical protein [Sphingobacterium sp.]APU97966.1 hypothetical protein BV902_17820 [Sphingobacterium sp. B29]OFV14964.1 hypothetical protein HMPREF3127_12995 [Sphingobacterium sp. HMSC13C05]QRQ62921.1 hypothetical protein I6J33_08120 [Sphingobacterium multivorum]TWI15595.1 hypothetical protein IQ31_04997 [Sphingobacterium siyangense]